MSTPIASRQLPEITGLLDILKQPAVILDASFRIQAANKAYRREFGENQPVHHRHCYEVSHHYAAPCSEAGEDCPLKSSQTSGQPQRVLHLHHSPRGQEHVDVEIFPIRNAKGEIIYFVEVMQSNHHASAKPSERGLVGRSPAFNRMLHLIERVAPSHANVLLQGESGTGKELVALALHEASTRAKGPFVPVDCSGLTETLFESELFGHEKGAFTGAHERTRGLVEAARGGTLFLDEAGDIPLGLQVKLLRLLETGTYRRVGGVEAIKADFRLVAATHRDLKSMMDSGQFRQDLYYRLSTFPIRLPALRERREDLPLLINSLLARVAGERQLAMHPSALDCLADYDFPGNIRELRNILERASLLCDGDVILPEHLPEECAETPPRPVTSTPFGPDLIPLDEVERRYLRWALIHANNNKRELAYRLGVSERTLYRKLEALQDSPVRKEI
ncbi:sigma-54 interaction domain-containing protein [Thermithiobacillus plumbiphilus]|uniref:Sigma 54-interacting transcriptional regulator n=1 Tax=Thermithiobacillus plumbiphilus TaxID=1729899 RepID=A0ABU9D4M5_9PROT